MKTIRLTRYEDGETHAAEDRVATEEPLQIHLTYSFKGTRVAKPLAVTMRTPGRDLELAAGFLFSEGVVRSREELTDIRYLGPGDSNEVMAEIRSDVDVEEQRINRNFYATSSCGICGKASIDAVPAGDVKPASFSLKLITTLPDKMRRSQPAFDETGGLHACALFNASGELQLVREDVGRHNAMDKVIGHEFLQSRVPLGDHVVVLSGRASFELIQKAAVAGIPAVVAVGAPSSLAVETAKRFGMLLAGFTRPDRCNLYSGIWS